MLLLVIGIDALRLADAQEYGLVDALGPAYRWGVTETFDYTLPSCSSFLTGLPPEAHGVSPHGHRDDPGTLRGIAKIQDLATYLPKALDPYRVGMSGVPCTWPPRALNGWVVSGILTPRDVIHVWPPEYQDKTRFPGMPMNRLVTLDECLQADADGVYNTRYMSSVLPVDVTIHYFSGCNRVYRKHDWRQPCMTATISEITELIAALQPAAVLIWSDHGQVDLPVNAIKDPGICVTHTHDGVVATNVPDCELPRDIVGIHKFIVDYVHSVEAPIWDRVTERHR